MAKTRKPTLLAFTALLFPVLGAVVVLLLVPLTIRDGDALPVLAASPGPARSQEPIRPLTAPAAIDPRLAALGRRLFEDPILSRDSSLSCQTCHDLSHGGVDSQAVAIGLGGAVGSSNTPTVYNAVLNLAQFWDGRARSLEEQIDGPLTSPAEMGSDWPGVLARLTASPYRAEFHALFGRDPNAETVRAAIAAFERTLVTTGSRFDAWLTGDEDALTPDEKAGYALFKSYGCASCHQGANVGGNLFQRFGFFGDLFADRSGGTAADLGRYLVTGRETDRHVFKVPSLRLATLTAPYFHDGSAPTLFEAIRLMGRYQLGREIDEGDIRLIVQFLATLPGRMVEDRP